jgi:hypothetical protein
MDTGEQIMPVQKSRRRLTREEITEILRTNADLFKAEPEFADYIVDLAIYLLDAYYEEIVQKRLESGKSGETGEKPAAPAVPSALTGGGKDALAKRYEILRSVSREGASRRCLVCGSKIGRDSRCLQCGNEAL